MTELNSELNLWQDLANIRPWTRFNTAQSTFNHAYFFLPRIGASSFKVTDNQKEEKINQSSSLVCLAHAWLLEVLLWDQRRGNNVTPKVCIMSNASVMSTKGSGDTWLPVKCCPVFQCGHIPICFWWAGISDNRDKGMWGFCFSFPENAMHPHWMHSEIQANACPSLPVSLDPLRTWLPASSETAFRGVLLLPAPPWAKEHPRSSVIEQLLPPTLTCQQTLSVATRVFLAKLGKIFEDEKADFETLDVTLSIEHLF